MTTTTITLSIPVEPGPCTELRERMPCRGWCGLDRPYWCTPCLYQEALEIAQILAKRAETWKQTKGGA